ncbi:MAG: hypothetical protein LC772_08245 [Chloroflexi bacterium]|nr:hypothetical protein [Chloroflexota bacterium]
MKRAAVVGVAALLLFVLAVRFAPVDDSAPPCACFTMQGTNGLWLKYTWYFGQYSPEDLQSLTQRLCTNQIRFAYFHVRYITQNGTLRFHYPAEARRLLNALHRAAPPVKAIAWIYAGNRRGSGHVNLADPAIRMTMVKEAAWLVNDCGFEGIQWDYEVCSDGDPDFLRLLRETRALVPPGTLLSAATQVWKPPPHRRWGWGDSYFQQVAAACDQLVVMGYDTGLHSADRYREFLRQQVLHVTAAAAVNPRCRVVIGIPAYQDPDSSHDPLVENIHVALQGVDEGLADPAAHRKAFAGVALFADYTTGEAGWEAYRKQWLKP